MNQRWNTKIIARAIDLAATGMHAGDIAREIGRTQTGVIQYCARHDIPVVRYSPEQQAMYDRNKRNSELKRTARKAAARAKAKLEARLANMARSGHLAVTVNAAASRTSVGYRAHMAPQREMTKAELRAMLAEAVRNTAEMQTA